jgi:uncharacterized peroxidase-related enzyme
LTDDDAATRATGFLDIPAATAEVQRLFDDDVADVGYVMNLSRVWAYQPAAVTGLFDLLQGVSSSAGLSFRQRGILVSACASTMGDSYCSLAWGTRLADAADPQTAAGVLQGDDASLTTSEQALATWARKVAGDPNHTSGADVQTLRDVGFSDSQIFAITAYVALRVAFSTVNDALGVRPDAVFRSSAPGPVRDVVSYGRPIAET